MQLLLLLREQIATKSSKEKKKPILEMQPSQNIIYKIVKKSREMKPLIFSIVI